jgi:hypothetical protein
MEDRKRSPEQILAALDEGDLADEAERVASLSEADVDRELVDAGLDPARVRADAQGVFESAMQKRAEVQRKTAPWSPPNGARVVAFDVRARPGRVSRASAIWIGAAAVAASVAFAVTLGSPAVVAWWRAGLGGGGEAAPAPGYRRAERLRGEAQASCAKAQWSACEASLDDARRLDPAGETAPDVKALREAIDVARRGGTRP